MLRLAQVRRAAAAAAATTATRAAAARTLPRTLPLASSTHARGGDAPPHRRALSTPSTARPVEAAQETHFEGHKLPSTVYRELVEQGGIQSDPAQLSTLTYIDALFRQLMAYQPEAERWNGVLRTRAEDASAAGSGGWLSSLFGGAKPAPPGAVSASRPLSQPRGLYLHGGPGSGKTFLMDMLHDALPVAEKRRMHFHEFMLDVHRTMHDMQRRGIQGQEMMDKCVVALRNKAWILFFDEFQVTDIADAMVMRRLFESLIRDAGLVMVATSNREPDELYKNGLQRDLFLPFIEELKLACRVVNMQSAVDYRLVASEHFASSEDELAAVVRGAAASADGAPPPADAHALGVYIVSDPANVKGEARFERLWEKLSKDDCVNDLVLRVQGRTLKVPLAGRHSDVARFAFQDLCGQPLGAVDYYCLAATFHTVFVDGLPRLSLREVNQLRRFITMIDTFYDQGVILVCKAHVPVERIMDADSFRDASAPTDVIGSSSYVPQTFDEVFAFARTASRLREMQTPAYLQRLAVQKRDQRRQSAVRFFSQFSLERESSGVPEGDARCIFDRFDTNGDDVLDSDELAVLLGDLTMYTSGHRHVSEEALAAAKRELDPAGRGTIAWDDFKAYVGAHGLSLVR